MGRKGPDSCFADHVGRIGRIRLLEIKQNDTIRGDIVGPNLLIHLNRPDRHDHFQNGGDIGRRVHRFNETPVHGEMNLKDPTTERLVRSRSADLHIDGPGWNRNRLLGLA